MPWSVIRQVGAILASVYGVLTASVGALHLPVAVSAILTAVGPMVVSIEHGVQPVVAALQAPRTVVQHQVTTTPAPVPSLDPKDAEIAALKAELAKVHPA